MTRGEPCGKRCLSCSPFDCENSIVFSRVVEDADPYRVSLKFMVLGSPIDCGNLVVFSEAPWCSVFVREFFVFCGRSKNLFGFLGRRGADPYRVSFKFIVLGSPFLHKLRLFQKKDFHQKIVAVRIFSRLRFLSVFFHFFIHKGLQPLLHRGV